MENSKNTLKKEGAGDIWLILPIILITTVFMFISRAKILPVYIQGAYWTGGAETDIDMFVYWKKMFFMAVTILGSLFLISEAAVGKTGIQKHKVYIPMAVYCIFVLLSFFFSPYKSLASTGANGRLEGTWVLICYMLITFFAMNAVKSDKSVKIICICFAVSCTLLGIWGVLEKFAGVKITSLPEFLYYPASIRDSVNVTQNGMVGYVEWFFTNMNYTSFFMVIPISIFAMASIGAENIKFKVFFAALTGLIIFNLFGASSLGGIVAVCCAAVMGAVVFGFANLKKWAKSIAVILVFAVIATAASVPSLKNEFKSTLAMDDESAPAVETAENAVQKEESISLFSAEEVIAAAADTTVLAAETVSSPDFFKIDYIKTDGSSVIFSFEGTAFTITANADNSVTVTDADGNISDSYMQYFTVSSRMDKMPGTDITTMFVDIKTADFTWNFGTYEGKIYYIASSGQGIELSGEVKSFGFKGHETFATNRGYIWSRSIPLIMDTIFLGHGADTFEMFFPHDDYAGKYNIGYYNDTDNVIIDKPHNMYIATAINTGVISLIALLCVYGFYIAESFKLYRKREFKTFKEYFGAGIMLAITGILVGGLVNDSVINVMAVSFTFMGVGFAVNKMIREEK